VRVCSYDERSQASQFDLIVNTTPVGMNAGEGMLFDYEQLRPGQIVYDIVYKPRETPLVLAARRKKCTVITGDEMLAGQGAAAFEIWAGVPAAQTLPVMKKALE
jgi:shikimate dehydrogenase